MSDDRAAELWAMAHLGTPMAIRVAATLRLADHLATGLGTAAELAEAAGAHPDALDRLLRYLAARGVFSRDDAGRYGLTELGQVLRSDHPGRMRAGLDLTGIGRIELAFTGLLHSVRTGEPAYQQVFGRDFWQDLADDPQRRAGFAAWMAANLPARSPAGAGRLRLGCARLAGRRRWRQRHAAGRAAAALPDAARHRAGPAGEHR